MTIFWVKSSRILCKLAHIFLLRQFENQIIFNFVIFEATKKGKTTNFSFFSPLLLPLVGSGMDKNQDRDKHPGSATLTVNEVMCLCTDLISDLAVDEVIALRLLLVLHILGLSLLGLVRPNRSMMLKSLTGRSRKIIELKSWPE
jgi:hypothetical protein